MLLLKKNKFHFNFTIIQKVINRNTTVNISLIISPHFELLDFKNLAKVKTKEKICKNICQKLLSLKNTKLI